MMYRVEKISGKRGMKDFNSLSYEIYRSDLNWVPPLEDVVNSTLDKKANPYFKNADLELFTECSGTGKMHSRNPSTEDEYLWIGNDSHEFYYLAIQHMEGGVTSYTLDVEYWCNTWICYPENNEVPMESTILNNVDKIDYQCVSEDDSHDWYKINVNPGLKNILIDTTGNARIH